MDVVAAQLITKKRDAFHPKGKTPRFVYSGSSVGETDDRQLTTARYQGPRMLYTPNWSVWLGQCGVGDIAERSGTVG